MKATLNRDMGCVPCREFPNGIKPSGTVIEHPDAYKLVRLGVATAADEECERKAGMTPQRMAAAVEYMDKLESGSMIPDDEDEDDEDEDDEDE